MIREKEQTKFLKIALNKRLKMNQHVNYVSRKTSNSHTLIHYVYGKTLVYQLKECGIQLY